MVHRDWQYSVLCFGACGKLSVEELWKIGETGSVSKGNGQCSDIWMGQSCRALDDVSLLTM